MANTAEKNRVSNTFKVLFIGLLVLLLLLPMAMVDSLIEEREQFYRTASDDVMSSWGGDIRIFTPELGHSRYGAYLARPDSGFLYKYSHIQPDTLSVHMDVETQIRERGIFTIPVYNADISIQGEFNPATDKHDTPVDTGKALAGRVFEVPLQATTIHDKPRLTWDGQPLAFVAERDSDNQDVLVFRAMIPDTGIQENRAIPFRVEMKLAGSRELRFYSLAGKTSLHMTSDWPTPGFFGNSLPITHEITEAGFTAHWSVNNYLADIGFERIERLSSDWQEKSGFLGIRFVQPADTYQIVTRSTKYAVLFILLVYTMYFFIEILYGVVLHPMHYLFIGFAKSIFYLLFLSMAEHINITWAYVISANASALLISLYSWNIVDSLARAIFIYAVLLLLYGFLYITLQSSGYALLTGSTGLFIILASLMYMTRNINWYRIGGIKTVVESSR